MSKISTPTKSFIILFFLAIFGTCLAITLWLNASNKIYDSTSNHNYLNEDAKIPDITTEEPKEPEVNTTTWKIYSKDGLSFKYSPDWKVLAPIKKGDYTIIQVDPGAKFYNIKIYISNTNFYVMDGLPFSTETINGNSAINVSNFLYGIKKNDKYYTFDIGLSTSLKPYFNALVHSVEFN